MRDQQPQLSVPEYSQRRAVRNFDLIENLAGRGKRLHKHSLFGCNLIGHNMQICFRQRQIAMMVEIEGEEPLLRGCPELVRGDAAIEIAIC